MTIKDDIRLGLLITEFRMRFPFLSIAFFDKPHKEGMSSHSANRLSPEQLIGEVRQVRATGFFQLDEQQKTGDFERMFSDIYGLHVQTYRLCGERWVETWGTDNWALGEQNHRGKLAANAKAEQIPKSFQSKL